MRGNFGCCGCPSKRSYDKIIKQYQDLDILDIAIKITKRNALAEKIKKQQKELNSLDNAISQFYESLK